MEIGSYGWKRDVDFIHHGLSLGGPQFINIPVPATYSYGLLNLGDGPFDGASPGYFANSPFSAVIAMNVKTASATRFFSCAAAGSQTFTMNADGTIFTSKNADATASQGVINIGTQFYSGAGQFAGSANGTYIAINSPTSFTGNAIDVQHNGLSNFSVNYNGFISSSNAMWITGTNFISGGGTLTIAQSSFTGSASGTGIAVNMPSGFTGNTVHLQLNGANTFVIASDGTTTINGALQLFATMTYYNGSQPTNGQLLIGNTTNHNFSMATLTAGAGVTITNGAGTITIDAASATDGLALEWMQVA